MSNINASWPRFPKSQKKSQKITGVSKTCTSANYNIKSYKTTFYPRKLFYATPFLMHNT